MPGAACGRAAYKGRRRSSRGPHNPEGGGSEAYHRLLVRRGVYSVLMPEAAEGDIAVRGVIPVLVVVPNPRAGVRSLSPPARARGARPRPGCNDRVE